MSCFEFVAKQNGRLLEGEWKSHVKGLWWFDLVVKNVILASTQFEESLASHWKSSMA